VIKVYHAPRTRSMRIIWLLEELGLPYEVVPVDFKPVAGKLFAQQTPFGKVPAIVDGDLRMFESGAIVEYLLERYGNGRLAPAPGTGERAQYLQWLHFSESTAFAPMSCLVWLLRYRDDADKHPELVTEARERAAIAFEVLEKALGEREYLLASGFSAADVMMAFSVFVAKVFGVLDDRFPKLGAYLARLEARPAYARAAKV
jgi:glutathione S-transferase